MYNWVSGETKRANGACFYTKKCGVVRTSGDCVQTYKGVRPF